MSKNDNIYNYIDSSIDYKRPLFNMPDLSGPQGNVMELWPMVYEKLKNLGFKKEAEFFSDRFGFMKCGLNYEQILKTFSLFLDFSPENNLDYHKNIIKEDNDFVYLKVRKEALHTELDLKQPLLFKIKDMESFKDMVNDNEDFSIQNCYGRNFAHYIESPELLASFLSLNEKYKWVDIFHLDNFMGSYLHSAPNLECFDLFLFKMAEENLEITKTLLFGSNKFNNSGFDNFNKMLSFYLLNDKNRCIRFLENEDFIINVTNILETLKKIDNNEFKSITSQFYTNEKILSYIENTDYVNKFNKMFFKIELDASLTKENDLNNKKVNKI